MLGMDYPIEAKVFEKYEGRYGERNILLINGDLYYKHNSVTHKLLPLSNRRFLLQEQYCVQLEFEELNGQPNLRMIYKYPEDSQRYDW